MLTAKFFRDCGYDQKGLNKSADHNMNMFIGHVTERQQLELAKRHANNMPLIVPVRHPYLTEVSWRKREKHNIEDMIQAYHHLTELDEYNPYYLPIDSPDRTQYLRSIGDNLGLRLNYQWSVVNSKQSTHLMKADDCQPSLEVVELAESIKPFLSQFY